MKKILIAIDGSEDSNKALALGAELAKSMDSEVVLVAVERGLEFYLPVLDYYLKKTAPADKEELQNKLASIAHDLLEESKKSLEKDGINVKTVVKWGKPAEEILKTTEEEGADLIVIGCRGKHLSKRLLGSVSDEVVERAKVPILVGR